MGSEVQANIPDELALVDRARTGDAAAFSDLVRIYQRRAVSVAYRLLGNSEDACDVAQDAFVRAYRCLDQLDNPARFGPWLMRVVSNLSLNYRRSRKNAKLGTFDEAVEATGEFRRPSSGRPWSNPSSGESSSLPEETHNAVSAAIERLPEKQRLALVLFSVEGMPQKEVAQILDCSIELVKWNVFQARKKLKEWLGDWLET